MKWLKKLAFGGLFLVLSSVQVQAAELNNNAALNGVDEVHVLYDVRKSNPKALLAYLGFIETNRKYLEEEGVKPNQRIVFISASLQFITTEPSDTVALEHEETLVKIAQQVERLKKMGVKMEACGTAAAFFNISVDTLLPGIKPVRSGFLSLMGWQAQGYQLIPVY
ncbi:DsrE family protein [Thiomicrospira pelophila]|uniref:DsrE family protein n=1 Tax=Thiomicrospira pelophila TaxID=934 RepID=UPI00068BD2B2|nr:DsrE family protein [Thiomicrospira pelophila]